MEVPQDKISELVASGYDHVYVWDAEPDEEDPDHFHEFDVYLSVVGGEIEIRMDGASKILAAGDEIHIPRGRVHYGKVGAEGCKYIVAEKH